MTAQSILVVDDEEILRVTLKKELEMNGYDVMIASGADEATELLKERTFNLVLTDLAMEGKNGLEVVKNAKTINPETMVILITAYGSLDTAISALQLGASDYILKPCDRKELVFRVRSCLDKQILNRKIKLYENILPVCSVCSKIRDDANKEPGTGDWLDITNYLERKSEVDVSHGYCPECLEREKQKFQDMKKNGELD